MNEYQTYEINGIDYEIEPMAHSKWQWTTDNEGGVLFDTQLETLQDALYHAHAKRIDDELEEEEKRNDAKYGTYEEQVRKIWKESRL